MRIVYPYTQRHRPVVEAAPADAEWFDVSSDPHAYWRLLGDMWSAGGTFMVVEHDVTVRPDVLEQFEACPELWCVFGYDPICHPECQEAWANMLGCTRFRQELIAACPDALSSIPDDRQPDHQGRLCDLRDWHNLCDSIAGDKIGGMSAPSRPGSLRHAGFTHHWHTPPVHHITWNRHPILGDD